LAIALATARGAISGETKSTPAGPPRRDVTKYFEISSATLLGGQRRSMDISLSAIPNAFVEKLVRSGLNNSAIVIAGAFCALASAAWLSPKGRMTFWRLNDSGWNPNGRGAGGDVVKNDGIGADLR